MPPFDQASVKDECRALFEPAVRGLPCDWRGRPKHSPQRAEVGASWRGEAGRAGERSNHNFVLWVLEEHTEKEEGSDFTPLMLSVSAHQAWRCFASDEGKILRRVCVCVCDASPFPTCTDRNVSWFAVVVQLTAEGMGNSFIALQTHAP